MNKMNVFSWRVLATPTSSNSPALACVNAHTENEILELDLKYGKGIFHRTWQVVLRGHFEVLVSLPFQKYKHVGPICNKAVFVCLCIYMPLVKAIDHTRILPPADLLYLYLFPRYDHLKITKGTTSISSERAKEYTNFTVPRSFLLEL